MMGTSNLTNLIFSTCFFHFRHLLAIADNFMKSRSRDGFAARNLLVYSPRTCTNFTMLIGWEHVNWSQTVQKVEIECKKLKLSAKSWNWVQKVEIESKNLKLNWLSGKSRKRNSQMANQIFCFQSSARPGWALRARAILSVFEKCTRAYLFQIALEIMWLPILIMNFLWRFSRQVGQRVEVRRK